MDFAVLLAPLRRLAAHGRWFLALIAVSVLLSLLPPLLQLTLNLPRHMNAELLLRLASVLPLEAYLIPRLLCALDAETRNFSENPAEGWRQAFDARWLLAFAMKVAVILAFGVGLTLFVLPGFLLLLAFGWAPLRILLRGETASVAARGSLAMSLRAWMPIACFGGFIGLLYLTPMLALSLLLVRLVGDPTPMARLAHPAFLGAYAFSGAMEVLLGVALLGLFHAVEAIAGIQRPK